VGESDDFTTPSLDRARWTVFNEDATRWDFGAGTLRITSQDGDLWEKRNDARNIFLQYAPEGDWSVATRVRFAPRADFEQASLVVWQDHSNYLRLSTLHDHGLKFETVREVKGKAESVQTSNTLGAAVWLRIEKRGARYDCAVSGDGEDWTKVATHTAALQEIKVGLTASAPVSKAARTAVFEGFELESGE
jgi:regulation of enolase protein 1 (concanavalin A-like superfamily)